MQFSITDRDGSLPSITAVIPPDVPDADTLPDTVQPVIFEFTALPARMATSFWPHTVFPGFRVRFLTAASSIAPKNFRLNLVPGSSV